MRSTRLLGIAGLGLAVAVSTAACSSSSSSSSSAASAPSSSTAASPTPIAAFTTLTGKQTAVTLNMSTITALQGLGVKVAPEGSATIVTLADGAAVAFPITGGHVSVFDKATVSPYVTGEVNHSGSGLTFSAGGKTLNATDFVVNPGTSMLTGTVGGQSTPLFLLDGSNLQITKGADGYHLDGTVVKLLPGAARALESYFGAKANSIPDYAPVGVAHIIAAGS